MKITTQGARNENTQDLFFNLADFHYLYFHHLHFLEAGEQKEQNINYNT